MKGSKEQFEEQREHEARPDVLAQAYIPAELNDWAERYRKNHGGMSRAALIRVALESFKRKNPAP